MKTGGAMKRRVGLWRDRWANGETCGAGGETGGAGERRVGLGYLAVFRRSSGCWYFLSL